MKIPHYITRPSTLTENAPLLIMLHGYGSDENDLFSFAAELPEELFIISARALHPMRPMGNAWYAIGMDATGNVQSDIPQAAIAREAIHDFIGYCKDTYPINADNITLLGFSQGTILSLSVAMKYPELVKNVVGLSGYTNRDLVGSDEDLISAFAKADKNPAFYVSHGTADQVIPLSLAQKTAPLLEKLGVDYKYSEFPVGHGVHPTNFYEFNDWLKDRI